jgi:hypothetical protein
VLSHVGFFIAFGGSNMRHCQAMLHEALPIARLVVAQPSTGQKRINELTTDWHDHWPACQDDPNDRMVDEGRKRPLAVRLQIAGPNFFRRSTVKLFELMILTVFTLELALPALRAQDSKLDQERAIAEIKKLGGKVEMDAKSPDMVVGVNLSHTKIVDASLEQLKGLSRIEVLILKDTTVTDDGIVHIKGLTNLEVLELRRTKVTDKGLEHLKDFSKLQRLDLGGTEVTDKGLEQLKRLTRLEALSLEDVSGVSDNGLAHLKGLTNLRTLNLAGTKVTDTGVKDLQKALPKLQIMR